VIRLERKPPRGAALEVPRAALPPPGEGEFYVVDLLGLEVFADDGRILGRVADVTPGVANDVLELDSGVALPMVEDCVREIDTRAGRIVVAASYASPR
jgi:16S rRNA processing protein RimM